MMIRYTPAQVYSVVSDVAKYQDFVKYCCGSEVLWQEVRSTAGSPWHPHPPALNSRPSDTTPLHATALMSAKKESDLCLGCVKTNK